MRNRVSAYASGSAGRVSPRSAASLTIPSQFFGFGRPVDHGETGGLQERRHAAVGRDHELLDQAPREVLLLDDETHDPAARHDGLGLDRLEGERSLLRPPPLHAHRGFVLEEDLFREARRLRNRPGDRTGPLQPGTDLLVDKFRPVRDDCPVDLAGLRAPVREDDVLDDDRRPVPAGEERGEAGRKAVGQHRERLDTGVDRGPVMGGVPVRRRPYRDAGVDVGDRDPDQDLAVWPFLADFQLVEVL
jgi:hypothetical protein